MAHNAQRYRRVGSVRAGAVSVAVRMVTMTLDLDQIKRNRTAGFYTDAGVLDRLIAEVERLQASLDQANKRIVELLGENRALKAELRGRELTPPSYVEALDGDEI